MPSNAHAAKGYDACQRQVGIWSQQALVTPTHRPLNYRETHRPREKGIDVALAIDFVRCAIEDDYDVGIMFSGDTDLLPALEMVIDKKGPASCEVAAWAPAQGGRHPRALRVKDRWTHIHFLDESRYRHVEDPTDYTKKRRRR
ncbi:NYN domain-containing protein [Iamia sp.]|uniref:NYN domain-containing protein n=1 Tax=Iamia sp. TaxID=2722710 RepID=UPI002C3494F1|nr:NYN domain-containing protein [Iamia sp.]HXH59656.1 NYN domain-containing protein [Iamia sp.]